MERNLLLAMLAISLFVFVVAVSSLYVEMQVITGNACNCAIPLWLFVPLLASLGLFIGALIYAILKPEESTNRKRLREILLAMCGSEEEKKVLEILLACEKISQSEITRKTKLNKVKVHRILKKFEKKGMIKREKRGKVVYVFPKI